MGGIGSAFTGSNLAYPTIIVKNMQGNVVSSSMISQKGIPPNNFTSLMIETKYRVNLQPNQSYQVLVKATMSGITYDVKYTNYARVGIVEIHKNISVTIGHATSGKIEIKLS